MEKIELSRGSLLLIQSNPYHQSIATCIGFPYGSVDESINGEAHLLEHMLFKGTKKRGWREIKQPIRNIGGYINAFTDFEKTLYITQVFKEDFGLSLDILSDMIQNSIFNKEELEREKNVVKSELLIHLDDPRAIAYENFPSVLYEKHPAKDPICGTEKSVMQIQREDLINEWKNNYTPESMVIGVAGGIEKERAKRKIEKAFKGFDRKFKGKKRQLIQESQKKKEIHQEKEGIKQSQFVIGYKIGCFRDNKKYWAFPIISQILSERVFNSVREKQGLSYDPYTSCRMSNTFGFIFTSLSLREEDVNLAKQIITDEYRKIYKGDLKAKEVEKNKKLIKKSHYLDSEKTLYSAKKMVDYYMLNQDPFLYQSFPKKIEQISFEDVREAAKNYLHPEKYGLLHLKPKI